MTDAIFKHQGTLDKYEGDAVMAFWGAPVKQVDHAVRACRAALDNLEALHELWKKWKERDLPRLDIRVGLNTGPMVVGNMGSPARMEYTVMGDSVNLGSRLEGANKVYGSHILISESTRIAAGAAIEARELDLLAVKGKKNSLKVFELLGMAGHVEPKRIKAARRFEEGLAAFRSRQWDQAAAAFGDAQALAGQPDRACALYLERMDAFRASPPPSDWDGVFRLAVK